MKITRRDLGVIMILVGVLAVFLTYRMYYAGKQTEVDNISKQIVELNSQIKELEPKVEREGTYRKEMENMSSEIKDILKEFKAKQLYEDGIMYIDEMQQKFDILIPSFTVSESTVSRTAEGSVNGEAANVILGYSSVNFNGTTKYDEFKNIVNYVYEDKDSKKDILAVSLSFDNKTGIVNLSMNYNVYVMDDGSREYKKQEIPEKDMSVDCIFGEVIDSKEETDN